MSDEDEDMKIVRKIAGEFCISLYERQASLQVGITALSMALGTVLAMFQAQAGAEIVDEVITSIAGGLRKAAQDMAPKFAEARPENASVH